MKKIFALIVIFGAISFSNAQFEVGTVPSELFDKNTFLDVSNYNDFETNVGKGLGFPRTNLITWEFITSDLGNFQFYKSAFDGLVVYNTGSGLTGATAATQGQQVSVEPGFYYFDNPTGNENSTDVSTGRWLSIGSVGGAAGAIKTREVIKTIPTNANTATVDLTVGDGGVGTGMAGVAVNQFIGAKIYNNTTGQLQMDASSSYVDGTAKILTTGNGFISQVLPAGTYKFVIEYK